MLSLMFRLSPQLKYVKEINVWHSLVNYHSKDQDQDQGDLMPLKLEKTLNSVSVL